MSGFGYVTLPDGTPVSSGEGGGVKVGGGGASPRQFTKHMYLPVEQVDAPAPEDAPPPPPGDVVNVGFVTPAPPEALPEPAPELVPAPELAPPAPTI